MSNHVTRVYPLFLVTCFFFYPEAPPGNSLLQSIIEIAGSIIYS